MARVLAHGPVFVTKIAPPARRHQTAMGTRKTVVSQKTKEDMTIPTVTGLIAAAQMAFPELAAASGREDFGLLAGRTVALIHPLIMGVLFAGSVYTGYLGWQWRRTRTIGREIDHLKKQLPSDEEELSLALQEVKAKIGTLTSERSDLVKGKFRDKHHDSASLLLGLGVSFSVAGAINTWMRTGKLFPGPHLFAGAAITALWAIAAAMVPAMQKGNETARYVHISSNALNVVLFAWQVPTGLEIVGKVFEFTTWP